MALDDRDRRRLFLAALVTVIALPAIWWANRDDSSTRPNVATAGVELTGSNAAADESQITPGTVGEDEPVYLDGPDGDAAPNRADIAVPASGKLSVRQSASYRSSIPPGTCVAKGATNGAQVRIVNLENNRSVTCIVTSAPDEQKEDLLMSRVSFLQLADLTDAPLHVEIRQ